MSQLKAMTDTATGNMRSQMTALAQSFWFWAAAIVAIRLVSLATSPANLGPDEAQYWLWAQSLEFGYFSKPPMIAWMIAATTGVFGDGEWAVRLAAPFLHFGAAAFLYLTAKELYDRRTAFIAGLTWLTLPGISLSSFLMTTDAPLLLFWSGALFVLVRILKGMDDWRHYGALGALIGLGLMSKYAMIFFPAACALGVAVSPDMRRLALRPQTLATALIATLIFAPNIAWNTAHDFHTVTHTAANANWASTLFNIAAMLEFFGSQFLVFGPILFATLLIALRLIIKNRAVETDEVILALFVVTPLAIVIAQAFISRAHANWAAAAYPAATILVAGFLSARSSQFWTKASLALHSGLGLFFVIGMSNFALLDAIGAGRTISELRGWDEITQGIADKAPGYDAILFDDRSMIAEMFYYQRESGLTFAALDPNRGVHHHYEAAYPFQPEVHKRTLLVSVLPTDAHVVYRFNTIIPRGQVTGDLGNDKTRIFTLFVIDDYFGPPL